MKKTLDEFIKESGIKQLAKKLDVVESSVRHWRRGYCLPEHRIMYTILKMSKGALTYEGVVETFVKQQKKK